MEIRSQSNSTARWSFCLGHAACFSSRVVRCFRTVSPTLTLGLPGLPSLFSSVTPQKLPIKSFEDYISLFGDDESGPIASSKLTKRWRVGVMPSPNGSFNQVSFVNGISTYKGGKHVDAAAEQVVRHLVDQYVHIW